MEVWAATKLENGHWSFEWDSNSGEVFDIWLDGELIDTAAGGEYDFDWHGYSTTPPPLEIVLTGSAAESDLYPPIALLQWRGSVNANSYVVEKYASGSWSSVRTIMESGAGYYAYQTAALVDQESTTYRVKAMDVFGNEGDALTFTFAVVRNPAPPDVAITIASGDLQVGAA